MDTITIIFNLIIYVFVPLTLIAIVAFTFSLLIKILTGIYLLLAAPLLLIGINLFPKSGENPKGCDFL